MRAISASLDHLAAEARDGRALRALLARGQAVVELDPGIIDPSFLADRLTGEEDDPDLATLAASVRDRGQQVPILVRPHPGASGRYQVAYGHRRLRAARLLGRAVRAVVRELSDDELVVAQGKENAERRDLSFVERALFARGLEAKGFPRSIIMEALAVGTAEVTRLLAVARAVPVDLAAAIGPAPRAGRPRWLLLASRLAQPGALPKAFAALAEEGAHALPSDERFARVLAAVEPPAPPSGGALWRDPRGRPVARYEVSNRRSRITVDEILAPSFGAYLLARLPALHASFEAGQESGAAGGGGAVGARAQPDDAPGLAPPGGPRGAREP